MTGFVLDLERFRDKATRNAETVVRKTAIDLFSRVVLRTPVDTGRARANWLTSLGGATVEQRDLFDPSGSLAISDITQAALDWDARSGSLFLTNNLPYIERLEHGHSAQAPVGMVKVTLTEFESIVEQAANGVAR